MHPIIRALFFVFIAIAGYAVIVGVPHIALLIGAYPESSSLLSYESLTFWLLGGGTWVWIIAVLMSIGAFFTAPPARLFLQWAPLYLTGLYCTGVLVYFNLA